MTNKERSDKINESLNLIIKQKEILNKLLKDVK